MIFDVDLLTHSEILRRLKGNMSDPAPVYIWTYTYPMGAPFIEHHFHYLRKRRPTLLVAKKRGRERRDGVVVLKDSVRPSFQFLGAMLKAKWCFFRYLPFFCRIGTLNELQYWGLPFDSLFSAVARDTPAGIHLCEFGHAVFLPLLLRRAGVIRGPVVAHFHGHDLSSKFESEPGYRRRIPRALRHVDGVVVVGRWMERLLVDFGIDASKIRVIPCGAHVEDPQVVSERLQQEPENESARCVFTFVGRLFEGKGPLETVRAFAHVAGMQDPPRIFLNMLGEGPLKEDVCVLVEELGLTDCVKVWGQVPHETVLHVLRETSVFVAPSQRTRDGWIEGWGIAPAEASGMGLPVVSTDHGGIPDHQIDGKTGFLVEEGDWRTMGRRMAELAHDPALRLAMGRAGYEHISEVGDRRMQLRELESYLDEVWRGWHLRRGPRGEIERSGMRQRRPG